MIKRYLLTSIFISFFFVSAAQTSSPKYIAQLQQRLDSLEKHIPALGKKVNTNIRDSQLPKFIRAIATVNKLNIAVDPNLNAIRVAQNFSDVAVKDVLIFCASKFNLEIDIIGSIISINKKKAPKPTPKEILITYDEGKKVISLDLKNDKLDAVFRKITQLTGKNIFFSPTLASKSVTFYLKELPLKDALKNLASTNDFLIDKIKDGSYRVSSKKDYSITSDRNRRSLKTKNFYFKVIDTVNKIIDVDINKIPIATVINEIGLDLKINMFTTAALPTNESTSFKANNIHFDSLLNYIFETAKEYSYKKEDNIYFFGKDDQASVRSTVRIELQHRSIQIMDESKTNSLVNNVNNSLTKNNGLPLRNTSRFTTQYSRENLSTNKNSFTTKKLDLLTIIPQEVRDSLQIQSDMELNSFIVSGPVKRIEKFKNFIKKIDKPIPRITIDVIILEVRKNASVSTGLELGLGDQPTKTKGGVYPNAELTLGANAINKIIGGFNGFGSLNLGKVSPNFYAKIQALETNGDLDIKSTPTLTVLNGHEGNFSNGERSYYVETITDIIGSQNPQTREIKNYIPVDANLSIKITPIVSGDGQITLSVKVVQSSFNGKKIDPQAPPGINTREFTSTIRVKDQDVVILGGLEENLKNDSGSGVPFLARIPIIKYLFSKRTRTASKSKLSVLIKPTIIRH
ncbi:MAG: general secretion pathway protein GspD [Flavobacteriaceae bacterium]|nr:general secretion pathway protein GspD [Flavobacteriaceae bacterium]